MMLRHRPYRVVMDHTRNIDCERWFRVATVPQPAFTSLTGHSEKAVLAALYSAVGKHSEWEIREPEAVASRIVDAGWLGLCESYLAQEWTTSQLPAVLESLIANGFHASFRVAKRISAALHERRAEFAGFELPSELVRLSHPGSLGEGGGIFASGVATTERIAMKSFEAGAGKRGKASHHFVDRTYVSPPVDIERRDIECAQRRAQQRLVDIAHIGQGSDVLEYPASRGEAAVLASERKAVVDVLTHDKEWAQYVHDTMVFSGADGNVTVHTLPWSAMSNEHVCLYEKERPEKYSSIISVERFEHYGDYQQKYLNILNNALDVGGNIGMQTVILTRPLTVAADEALSGLYRYIWPHLYWRRMDEIARMVDATSHLRIVGEYHFGSHYEEIVRMQRDLFDGRAADAAAAGFDEVFRRLWSFQYALREAFFHMGLCDAVHVHMTSRTRH